MFWTRDAFIASRAGGLLSISDQNLKSAAMRIAHGPVAPGVLWSVTIVVGLGGLGLAAWANRASSPMLGILVCAVTGLIVSPITWSHHLVWAVPAIGWFALGTDAPARGRRWAVAIALFFWARPIWWVPRHDRGLHEKPWELIVGDSYLWAMLAFLLGVAVLLARRRRLELQGHRAEAAGTVHVAGCIFALRSLPAHARRRIRRRARSAAGRAGPPGPGDRLGRPDRARAAMARTSDPATPVPAMASPVRSPGGS